MFVRVVSYFRSGSSDKEYETLGGQSGEWIYQCRQIHMKASEPGKVLVTLEDNAPHRSAILELRKASSELYIMNDEGRTIDSYRWASAFIKDNTGST